MSPHDGSGGRAHAPISERIWRTKYRRVGLDGHRDATPRDTFRRVARALASVETHGQARQEHRFLDLMASSRFLPGGRVLAGAGARGDVTLLNCFVLPPPEGDPASLDHARARMLRTLRFGGGVGFDASRIAPAGAEADGGVTRGPVDFLTELEAQCDSALATRRRRGAMMATLACDHPDIARFIDAKAAAGVLGHFNLSVLVPDAFLAAEADDRPWPLCFAGRGAGTVPARALWDRLLRAAFATAEPGVLFVDRINALNTLWYRERLTATNPCGEVPLPPFGACVLGSLNLPRFVRAPFTPSARIDEADLERSTATAVHMLDNVIDLSAYPLPEQRVEAQATRRIGLGIMGLADMLLMLGLRYDSAAARIRVERVMRLIRQAACRASVARARERGAFPAFRRDDYLAGGFVSTLDHDEREAIARHGIRNSHLLAIAPTGSISLLAGAVSSGIEPVFGADYARPAPGSRDGETIIITDEAVARWRERFDATTDPPAFITAAGVSPRDQLAMQAVVQRHVDGAISKTVQLAPDATFAMFHAVYREAHALGLKGCTVFRPGTPRGSLIRMCRPGDAGECAASS